MKLFEKIFNKSKNTYKISQKQEETLVCMLKPRKKVKLKSKIVVPNNFCAVLLSKEKLLDIIPSGEHELNGFTIEKTCKINKLDKPTKKGYKKEMKLDFYFVNLNVCKISSEFEIKKIKTNITYVLNFKINNSHKFLKFLIEDRIIFDDKFATYHLTFSFSRLLYYYFLDNKIIEENKLTTFITKKLNHIGLEVLDFEFVSKNFEQKLELKNQNSNNLNNQNDNTNFDDNDNSEENFTNNTSKKIENKSQYFYENYLESKIDNNTIKNKSFGINCDDYEKKLTKNEEILSNFNEKQQNFQQILNNQHNNTSLIKLDDITSETISYFVCDECGAKLPKNSLVCYKCKKSFVEKNTCENCGREIKKGTYVCPYCNCVLIK